MTHAYQLHELLLSEVPDLSNKVILECAVGHGVWGYLLRSEKNASDGYLVGFDLYKPYLKYCKKYKVYDDLVLADAKYLPFRRKSIDIILAAELLEHLELEDGIIFLDSIDLLCREVAILSTPNGFAPEGHLINESPLERHISAWSVTDFRRRNYKVRGIGLKYSWIFYSGRRRDASSFIHAFFRYVFTPLAYIFPSIGWILIATKKFTTSKIRY